VINVRTEYRERLQRGFSYPVGLRDLARSLGAVPQASNLHVKFHRSPTTSLSRFRAGIQEGRSYPVVKATFARWDKQPSIGDDPRHSEMLEGLWTVDVFPVPSKLRSIARQELLDVGLPALSAWLSRRRPPAWYHGLKRCDVILEPVEGKVKAEEYVEAV